MDMECEINQYTIKQIINPLNLPGFHYLCKSCEEDIIPQTYITSTLQPTTLTDPVILVDPSQTSTTEDIQSSINGQQNNSLHDDFTSENNMMRSVFNNNVGDHQQTRPPSSFPQDSYIKINLEESSVNGNDDDNIIEKSPNICNFKKGSCKHGLKGKNCKYTHPKMCTKFTQHGTRKPRGCTLGKKCNYFHPQMCIESLRTSECYDNHCKFRHIKGTRRIPLPKSNEPNQNKHLLPPTPPYQHTPYISPGETTTNQNTISYAAPTDTNEAFLGIIHRTVQLLEAVEAKVTTLFTQLQPSQQVIQHHPTQMQFHQPNHMVLPHHQQVPQQIQPIQFSQQRMI